MHLNASPNDKLRTRVKICGLTRSQDLSAAIHYGADAIGLVFYPKSQRFIDLSSAALLRREVPAFVSVVALFVNPTDDWVDQVVRQVEPDILQFHGQESADQCYAYQKRYQRPFLKAFAAGAPGLEATPSLLKSLQLYSKAAGHLIDSYSVGHGGSGLTFDWQLVAAIEPQQLPVPLIISGGLHVGNVAQAIRLLSPYAVDVSSGVEQIISKADSLSDFSSNDLGRGVETLKGIKDPTRIRQFMQIVRSVSDSSVYPNT